MYATTAAAARALIEKRMEKSALMVKAVTSGSTNEVFEVETEREVFILRLGRAEDSGFPSEIHAMNLYRGGGVLVPEILELAQVEINGQQREVMVMRQFEGKALEDIAAKLTAAELENVLVRLGAVLRKMHAVKVEGFGLYKSGAWMYSDWSHNVQALLEERERDLPLLRELDLSPEELEGLMTIAHKMQVIPCETASLCHGDFSMQHVFFNDGLELTGIIDFGLTQGGHPTLDFALFNMYHAELGLEPLMKGYGDDLSEAFFPQMYAQQVNTQLSFTADAVRRGIVLSWALPYQVCARRFKSGDISTNLFTVSSECCRYRSYLFSGGVQA